ncbi:cytochrome c family protein [Tropicimonas sp. IMCC34011]|uniref:c-type cytochrome n=1 Tax=Tropicimonas sp. IMCC34011 TaxID=2248759 RepID=UPI000E258288|nr:cytochrome c family protein [Tropicimonas sp. IMCC34011]
MFDTMTGVKLIGGFCGTLLVFLLGAWAAEELYHVGEVAHGDEEVHQAYTIPVPEDGAAAPEEDAVPFEEVFAAADPGAGERVFAKCRACHQLEPGANATGPTLYDVVGRAVDSIDGYAYSGALEEVADVWDPGHLNGFLENPRGYAPGTKMSFAGLPDVEDRANLIAWLETNPGG